MPDGKQNLSKQKSGVTELDQQEDDSATGIAQSHYRTRGSPLPSRSTADGRILAFNITPDCSIGRRKADHRPKTSGEWLLPFKANRFADLEHSLVDRAIPNRAHIDRMIIFFQESLPAPKGDLCRKLE
jgi:hypothetical protein